MSSTEERPVKRRTSSSSGSRTRSSSGSSSARSRKTASASAKTAHRRRKKTVRRLKLRNFFMVLLILAICFEMVFGLAGLLMLRSMLSTKPKLIVDDFFSAESSHIYDKNGELIADVGTQLRENVTYEQISESVIDAFLAVEDSRYFEHDGFDLPRFTKSAMDNVLNKLRRKSGLSGGSTFTMQLVKLTYFQNDETGVTASRNIAYKVQQIALARELEKQSNKKAIFEMYLNKMNFGGTGNIRGIQKAAEYYYGKSAGELNLAEAAMLAGVINAPYTYDPHNFLDNATKRRNTVLSLMVRHGYITDREYALAKAIKVEDTLIDPSSRGGTGEAFAYQSYIDTVIEEAAAITGVDPLSVAMDIYTYMDPQVQSVMDGIQAGKYDQVVFPDDLMEIGMIAENNQTGEIVGIGGGRNYGRGGSMLLNHATDQYKQPGSSVKPFLDYALAFEYLGWATSHVVTDRPIAYEGTDVIIKNANGVYHGQVTLAYAISASLNTPAVQALQDVINTAGWNTVVSFINSLGFSKVTYDNFDMGFAIGGSNFTASCQELMAAHAILVNGGNYIKPHTISKIVYRNGTNEPLVPVYEKTNVLSPQAAYLAAQLMYTAVHGGVYNYLDILTRDYQTFGKTGTSDWGDEGLQYNIPQGASKDKWMVCDTSEYTITTWVGYEKGVKDKDTYFSSEKSQLNIPGNICSLILDAVQHDSYPADLAMPEGISSITHILGTFPYASPAENMEPSLITTGLIKSNYASLVSPESAESPDTLEEFKAEYADGVLRMMWTEYPDPNKLKVGEGEMDISLKNADGSVILACTGQQLFDWSWVYGPIRYKARISKGGESLDLMSEENYFETELELEPDTTYEACGFYGYESYDSNSNEICVSFKTDGSGSLDNLTNPFGNLTPSPSPEATTPPETEEPKPEETPQSEEGGTEEPTE